MKFASVLILKLSLRSLLLFELVFMPALFLSLSAIQTDEAPTPMPRASLFVNDTCSAPCWFGLISGISTSTDVEALLRDRADIFYGGINEVAFEQEFDLRTHLLENGHFSLYFMLCCKDQRQGQRWRS